MVILPAVTVMPPDVTVRPEPAVIVVEALIAPVAVMAPDVIAPTAISPDVPRLTSMLAVLALVASEILEEV
jgi:hypothetical protein